MGGVDNKGSLFFSQTAAVGFLLQGKGIKIILENLKMFLTGICQVGFISPGTSHQAGVSARPQRLLQRAVHLGFTWERREEPFSPSPSITYQRGSAELSAQSSTVTSEGTLAGFQVSRVSPLVYLPGLCGCLGCSGVSWVTLGMS